MKKIFSCLMFFSLVIFMSVGNSAENPVNPISTYGVKSSQAPTELDIFSFLVGKHEGTGKTRLEDGSYAEFDITWTGRYILDGMAIADEFHSVNPDGSPYLGVSLRHYDPQKSAWIVEYVNVSFSFLRRQVNTEFGSVSTEGNKVIVLADAGGTHSREIYTVIDDTKFSYSIDTSADQGQTWNSGQIEMTLTRTE